ncbi:PaaI family thioesterase [Pseudoruegeria sp. HB172150]|uniref:PaaI family thioesterase n=1 Tax=Pseudoruegeria sp. HB172150 TaxID=2721164 RepID=UPI00155449C9|nr:PaaI family thioesterase [Pseudoruegeria sp. HB172150]
MNPRFAGYEAKLHDSFDRQAMMTLLGARLSAVSPGEVEITAPVLDTTRQQHGYAHAAVSFALGDTAAGYAALSLMEEEDEVLTVEMKINLLSPATGTSLIAKGKVIRPGKRIVVVNAEVWAEAGGTSKQVALLQGTMIPVRA